MQFLDKARIKNQQIKEDIIDYLSAKYGQSRKMFSYSTSFGQIILVMINLFNLLMYYLSDVGSEKNIVTANRTNSIYGMAALTGHSAKGSTSAVGTIGITIKPGADLSTVSGGIVYLINHSILNCKYNNLKYMLDLGADSIPIDLSKTGSELEIRIRQGEYKTQQFTGSGDNLQSFTVDISAGKAADIDGVMVTVNNVRYKIYKSIYDIPYGEAGCIVKRGTNGGIDVFFGNSISSQVPSLGSTIIIDYVINNGSSGNIIGNTSYAEFVFEDNGIDATGAEVDMNTIFSISTLIPPVLGSDQEAPAMTRLLAPMYNRNDTIHDAGTLRYSLMKTGIMKSVNITAKENNTYLVIPILDVRNRITQSEGYFTAPLSNFLLTSTESSELYRMITAAGKISTSIDLEINNPTIRRYVLYILINIFTSLDGQPVSESEVKTKIINGINDHLISTNKILISDITKLVDNIEGVDSAKIVAISEQNEKAYLASVEAGTDHTKIGFDSIGNIKVNDNELAVVRGGWSDRDGISYEDTVSNNSLKMGSLNIIINEKI